MAAEVITCDCGAKVRLPAQQGSRSFRCPKCKMGLAITVDAAVLSLTKLSPGMETACPICQTTIVPEEACVTCPSCDQVHHRECWSEIGGCGTYGCEQAPSLEKSETSVQTPLSAWGDTKRCPACGEEIKSIALKCRYCQTEFSSVDPLSMKDLRIQVKTSEEIEIVQKRVVLLFVLSLIGCLAPLVALVGLIYVLPRRKILAKSSPLYHIMAFVSIALSCLYSVLILLFLLFGTK